MEELYWCGIDFYDCHIFMVLEGFRLNQFFCWPG